MHCFSLYIVFLLFILNHTRSISKQRGSTSKVGHQKEVNQNPAAQAALEMLKEEWCTFAFAFVTFLSFRCI